MKPCRWLKGHECVYWDATLTEDETLRCQMPGGWSEECYEEDTTDDKVVFEEGRWMTLEDARDVWEERFPDGLPEHLEFILHMPLAVDVKGVTVPITKLNQIPVPEREHIPRRELQPRDERRSLMEVVFFSPVGDVASVIVTVVIVLIGLAILALGPWRG